MKKKTAFETAKSYWDQLSPQQKRAAIGYLYSKSKDFAGWLRGKVQRGEIKFPDFRLSKDPFSKKESSLSKSEKIIVLSSLPDDRDPWWRVFKIKPYATEQEIHAAYEKLLAASHPKKSGKVTSRTLRERAQKAARLQQAYDDALESLKQRE
ncbi:MAG: hypothetical protein WAL87_00415 [Chthoniobacterales bacterium]